MSFHSELSFDFNYMLQGPLGAKRGLDSSEIEALFPAAKQIQKALNDLQRLGQLPLQDLPYHEEQARVLEEAGRKIHDSFDDIIILGIGGSALGPRCLYDFLKPPYSQLRRKSESGHPRLFVIDNVDSLVWQGLLEVIDLEKTLFIVTSKSGQTVETLASFCYYRDKLITKRGATGWRSHFVFITDPEAGPLRNIAEQEKIQSYEIPPGLGGRYSVLSPVGLLAAAATGLDIQALLQGARHMHERSQESDLWINPPYLSAILNYRMIQSRDTPNRIMMPYVESMETFTEWYSQLWAESLGKDRTIDGHSIRAGSTPIRAMGASDQHSQLQLYLEGPQDKVVTFFTTSDGAADALPSAYPQHADFLGLQGIELGELINIEYRATEQALRNKGIPSMTIHLPHLNENSLGQLLYFAEIETIVTGQLYNINPFDQPAVEAIKKYIKALLGFSGFETERQEIETSGKEDRYII